jgi:hypothetical protein
MKNGLARKLKDKDVCTMFNVKKMRKLDQRAALLDQRGREKESYKKAGKLTSKGRIIFNSSNKE